MADREPEIITKEMLEDSVENIPTTIEHLNRGAGKSYKSEKKYKVGSDYSTDTQFHKNMGK